MNYNTILDLKDFVKFYLLYFDILKMKNKNTTAFYIIIVIYNYCRVAVVVERGEDEGVNVKWLKASTHIDHWNNIKPRQRTYRNWRSIKDKKQRSKRDDSLNTGDQTEW